VPDEVDVGRAVERNDERGNRILENDEPAAALQLKIDLVGGKSFNALDFHRRRFSR